MDMVESNSGDGSTAPSALTVSLGDTVGLPSGGGWIDSSLDNRAPDFGVTEMSGPLSRTTYVEVMMPTSREISTQQQRNRQRYAFTANDSLVRNI